jgi:hypothetical protein
MRNSNAWKRVHFIAAAITLTFIPSAFALTARVFVSSAGADAGACPITAPCRTFAYAITQVSDGGEIIALETAGYGQVVIDRSVSIVAAPGVTAFVNGTAGEAAIDVAPGPAGIVTLRGLALSTSTGIHYGVRGLDVLTLNIENCVIDGFSFRGVEFQKGGYTKPRVNLVNTLIRNGSMGLLIGSNTFDPLGLTYATISDCTFEGQIDYGVYATQNSRITITNTVFTANHYGVLVGGQSDSMPAEVTIERSTFSRNGTAVAAFAAPGAQVVQGTARLSNCEITSNDKGLDAIGAMSRILSRVSNGVLTNTVEGNGIDGTATGTYTAK